MNSQRATSEQRRERAETRPALRQDRHLGGRGGDALQGEIPNPAYAPAKRTPVEIDEEAAA